MKDHRTPWAVLRYKDWTIEGEIQKIDGNAYTIKDGHGGQVRLHMEESALQGKSFQEGDKVKANIKNGDETYTVLSTKKADQSSMHFQSQSGEMQSDQPTPSQGQSSLQDGTFTKTVRGEVQDIEGSAYYLQDPSGKEVRLRIDQSTENQ